jgi:hypothetical protein
MLFNFKLSMYHSILSSPPPPPHTRTYPAHPNPLVGQFVNLLPPGCRDTTVPIEAGTVAKLLCSNVRAVQGGLCLAGLLASTPGPRPWSRDMRADYHSSGHFLESCLSRKFAPCVVNPDRDKLQAVLCAI